MNWSNLDNIKAWVLKNRNEFLVFDTKTIKNTSKYERYVLINYSKNPIINSWWDKFSNLKKGFNCNHDRKKHQNYNTNTYRKELSINKPHLSLICNFTNIKDKHKFYCNKHKVEFITTADRCLHRQYGCLHCSKEAQSKKLRKSHEDFVKDLTLKFGKEFEVIDKYITQDTIIRFKHVTCGKIFSTSPNSILYSHGCFCCKMSFGEKVLKNYFVENSVKFYKEYKFKDCFDKSLLSFDFYLPDLNTCVEFDGKQHYVPNKVFGGLKAYVDLKRRDFLKNKYCQEKNIRLIRIPYWDLRNIYKILIDKDIV